MWNAVDLDGCAPAFIRTLTGMQAEAILSCRDDDSPLSILLDAMLPSVQEHGVLSDLWTMLRSAITYGGNGEASGSGAIATRRQQSTIKGAPVRAGSVPDEVDLVSRRDRRIPAIIECIGIIADKIEQARLASMKRGKITHEVFVRNVEKFLQQEHVCIHSCNGDSTEVRRSFIYMLCIQYFMNTGNKERQGLILGVIKKFLLGFSRYALDGRGARSIHYALSMCGGMHEAQFMTEIIRPLIAQEMRRFRTECTDSSLSTVLKDREGNGPLHYALSSVYCSEGAVRYVLSRLDKIDVPGEPALLQEFIAGVPYYALFCSLSEDCMRFRSAFKQSNVELRNAICWLDGRSDPKMMDLHSVSRVLRRRLESSDGLSERLRSFNGRFYSIFRMLRAKDARIRGTGALLQYEAFAPAQEFFSYCKQRLDSIRAESDAESNLFDGLIRDRFGELFSFSKHKHLGAKAAAHEVMGYVLSDNAYIRRVNICADYARKRFNSSAAKSNEEWPYDTYTTVVNCFFAVMCSMCKPASKFFRDHTELCKGFLHAKGVYNKERAALAVYCYLLLGGGVVTLVCIFVGIFMGSQAPPDVKLWQIFGFSWTAILLCTALCAYCLLERMNVTREILKLERGSESYILGILHDGERALAGNSPRVGVEAPGPVLACGAPTTAEVSMPAITEPSAGVRVGYVAGIS